MAVRLGQRQCRSMRWKFILEVEPAGFGHWLDLSTEGKEKAKMTPTFLARATAWMKEPFTEMEKARGGTA